MRKLSANTSLETKTDEELVSLIHSGSDQKIAGELFKRYAHLVFGVCMKYLKNKSNSNDILMDVFEKFLKKPPVENVLSFKHWLLTVTKHTCLTFLRDRKRNTSQNEKWQDFEKSTQSFMENDAFRSLNNKTSDLDQIQTALKQLKEPQRICIQLFYLEGKSYKEIEKKTDFDLNQIKSYLQNGKRKLKLLVERTHDVD